MSRKISVNLLEDGNVLPVGCRISRGQLLPALSPVKIGVTIQGDILFAGRAESIGKFFLADSQTLYVSTSGAEFYSLAPLTGGTPFMYEETEGGAPRAVICGGEHAYAHTGDSYRGMTCGAGYSCGALHCGRLFGGDFADGYLLRWSGEGGLEDGEQKNGAGYLYLDPKRGKILDIVEYGEKLILIRERGLSVLKMFGNPDNFSAEITETDTDPIYRGTARVVAGKLVFCTLSGLKGFDGNRIEELPHRYAAAISSPTCSAEFSGTYFLGCTNKNTDSRCVLCYDPADGESYIIDVPADAISAADKVYVFGNGELYELREGGEYSFSASCDFGNGGYKTLTEIYSDSSLDLKVGSGRVSRIFTGAFGKIRPRLKGKKFTVEGTGVKPVKALCAAAEELDEI